jgi:tubulin-specific chaperone D
MDVQLFPQVSDLEPVLKMLMEQDAGDVDTWATRHMLLLWLSIIVMMPFHMSRLDSFTAQDADGRKTAMERYKII